MSRRTSLRVAMLALGTAAFLAARTDAAGPKPTQAPTPPAKAAPPAPRTFNVKDGFVMTGLGAPTVTFTPRTFNPRDGFLMTGLGAPTVTFTPRTFNPTDGFVMTGLSPAGK